MAYKLLVVQLQISPLNVQEWAEVLHMCMYVHNMHWLYVCMCVCVCVCVCELNDCFGFSLI